jgi:hypothetical protein
MNKNARLFQFIAAIIFFCLGYLYSQIPGGYKSGLDYINKEDLHTYITFLASDSLKGRSAGSPENFEAAKFIAQKFSSFGLKPYVEPKSSSSKTEIAADDDDKDVPMYVTPKHEETPFEKYFQKFYILDSKIDQENTALSISTKNESISKKLSYNFKKDFLVDYRELKNLAMEAKVVFLGYGIEKGEESYSDYVDANGKEIDIKNKIVLIVESFPGEKDSLSPFNKVKNHIYKNTRRKAETAFEKGAAAVLVTKSPFNDFPPFPVHYEGYANAFSKSNFTLPGLKRKESVPIFYVDDAVVTELFDQSGKSFLKVLAEIDSSYKGKPFELNNKTVAFDIKFDNKLVPVQNVIGYIEGSDPVLKDEYIVIGAHYDHVGFAYYGAMDKKNIGQIHNGADDNASGTSGIIELAEAFSKTKPKRSIIFIAFTAEENGLLGSRYYAYQNPFRSTEKTAGMINLDMIGRNEDNVLWVGGIFYSDEMKYLVEEANKEIGFELLYNVGLLTFGSDQGPFIRKEVPSIFFFTGLHDDYHTPLDDVEKINFAKSEKVVKLAFISGWMLANKNETPRYRELTMDEKIALVKHSLERQKKFK